MVVDRDDRLAARIVPGNDPPHLKTHVASPAAKIACIVTRKAHA
jgi:hypothetical protein